MKEISATDREYYIDQVILDQNGTVKSYQTAGGYATPNPNGAAVGYFYQVKDWLGSPHITMSSNGTVQNAIDYYSYGKAMPTRNTFATGYEGYRYQFTGHEKDGETSYQYHGARYYEEDLGRYMSVDPLATQFHAWSPYNYVMGNPIRMSDPTGKVPFDWIKKYGSNTWVWDAEVRSSSQAVSKYGTGTDHAKPGYKYPSANGNVELKDAGKWDYTGAAVTNQGMPIQDINSEGSNSNPFLSNLRQPGNFDFNHVPIDFPETYDIAGPLGNVFAVTMTALVTGGVGAELGAAGYGAKELGGLI